jgi:hypothetical protein
MKKIFTVIMLGFVGCSFLVGCESKPKEIPVVTSQQIEYWKTHEKERGLQDEICKKLSENEVAYDGDCLAVQIAHTQLLRQNYTYKGPAPKTHTKFPGM